jgi:type II secretory pathway component PulK
MTRLLGWMWHELTRERSFGRSRRARREGRSSRAGVALLLVVSIVALLTVIVTEVVSTASIRIRLAAAERDEAKAEALAQGGIQFYRLLLMASKQLENSGIAQMLAQYMPGAQNATQLWQVLPVVNSSLMRMLLFVDGDEDEAAEIKQAGGLTDAQREQQQEEIQTSLRKPFLDFDGDFTAEVVDEERRIWIGSFQAADMVALQSDVHARLLATLMSMEENNAYLREKGLDKWELIGDLADWTDADNDRIWQNGREDAIYERMEVEKPYLPKNTRFDTLEEVRLVNNWNRDAIWQRFGTHLTIYGPGKVNINTAQPQVLESILMQFIQPVPSQDSVDFIVRELNRCRSMPLTDGGCVFNTAQQFVDILQTIAPGNVDPALAEAIDTKSRVFRVTSTGEVGTARVAIQAVFEFPDGSAAGRIVYWRVQ